MACDSAEGIQRWWLPDRRIASIGEIESTLAWLIEQQAVEIVQTGARVVLYRRHADATDEDIVLIAAKLTEHTSQGGP